MKFIANNFGIAPVTSPAGVRICFSLKYPNTPGGITDPEYSINVGIQNLADCLSQAGAEDPADIERISLALQGYNFGSGYISWALRNYSGYTELSAIEFSEMMASAWAGQAMATRSMSSMC